MAGLFSRSNICPACKRDITGRFENTGTMVNPQVACPDCGVRLHVSRLSVLFWLLGLALFVPMLPFIFYADSSPNPYMKYWAIGGLALAFIFFILAVINFRYVVKEEKKGGERKR